MSYTANVTSSAGLVQCGKGSVNNRLGKNSVGLAKSLGHAKHNQNNDLEDPDGNGVQRHALCYCTR